MALVRPSEPHRVTFRIEPFNQIARELPPLFEAHWRELALNQDEIPLRPDWDMYLKFDLARVLHIVTARHQGKLVGYIFSFVNNHLHYAITSHAIVDMFWLAPEHRKGRNGIRLIKAHEKMCRNLDVKKICISEKIHFANMRGRGLGKLFERLGYVAIEVAYSKVL